MGQFLSMLGVGVFASSGALAALRRGFDPLGVLVIAFVTALGGGTVRDLLLDRHPIFWVEDPTPLFVIIFAFLTTLLFVRYRNPPMNSLRVADAIGLAYFSIVGAQLAEEQRLKPIIVILMGTITGSVGGLIRDVLSGEVPLLLRDGDLYATASIMGIITYLTIQSMGFSPSIASYFGMATIACVRFVAIRWNLRLPIYRLRDDFSGPR